jgi:SagB-type dehydrogenase family enzyme
VAAGVEQRTSSLPLNDEKMATRVKLMNSHPAEPDRLFEVFHENTKHFWSESTDTGERIGRYLNAERSIRETASNYKVYRLLPRIELPAAEPLPQPLSTAMAGRVSVRRFGGEPVTLQALSNLLYHSLACNRQAFSVKVKDVTVRFRSYPSGGGLYPVEMYPILLHVAGVPRAVTHYDPVNHRLNVINGDVDPAAFAQALVSNDGIAESAAFAVFMSGVFERTVVKYGDRGYRLCLLEAGHAAQNICLSAVSQGLGTLAYAGYDDDAVAQWLDIDGLNEAVVHAVFGGHPA